MERLLTENIIKDNFNNIKNSLMLEKAIAIWGAGRGGKKVLEFLKIIEWNGHIDFLDTAKSKQGMKYGGIEILSPDFFLKETHNQDKVILISCADIQGVYKSIKKYKHGKVIICDFTTIDFSELPFEYIQKHISELKYAYSLLSDQRSRDVFIGVLNYRISRNRKYMEMIVDNKEKQYFDETFVNLNNSCFVDCGAYIGDTVNDIVKKSKGRYRKIICLEPDKNNYDKLMKNISQNRWKNIETHNIAAYSQKTKLNFDTISLGGGTSNHISEMGNIRVNADTLDHIIKEPIDYIKMDIEGSEEEALKGACQIIKRYLPCLIICIYHKKEDFFTIPTLINEISDKYRLYIRQYSEADAETVLYAVPDRN